jgi:NTP pyrophosphatase (non-canonical NTP hydrolase)
MANGELHLLDFVERQRIERALEVLGRVIHNTRVRHAFKTTWENLPTKMMLVVTELAEAIEAHRELHADAIPFINPLRMTTTDTSVPAKFREIKAAIAEELADAFIRIMDISTALDLPFVEQLLQKLEANEQRPRLHGKRY